MAKKNIIHLDYSGVGYPPSPKVIKAINGSLPKINAYPYEWYGELNRAIADYCKVKESNALPTNGGDEAIGLLTYLFGKRVLIPVPTYSEYEYIAKSMGAEIKMKDCMPDGLSYRLDYSDEELEWATLVWICNPNNPTGDGIPRDIIINVLEHAKGVVVVDEAYYEFYGKSVADLVGRYKNLVVLRTFSKAFRIAGLRLGYILSNPDMVERINRSKQEFNVSRVARDAGIAVLKSLPYYRRQITKVVKQRDSLEGFCAANGIKAFKSNGGFIFLRFSSDAEIDYVYSWMKRHGVIPFIASDSEFTGLKGPYMRVAIGSNDDMEHFKGHLLGALSHYRHINAEKPER